MRFTLLVLSLVLTTARDEYSVDEFYVKITPETETLDEDGQELDFIFVRTSIKPGKYEITIEDGPGDLYEIRGTSYFIKFRSHFGYAGYGTEGLLVVQSSAWSSSFIRYD